MHKTFKDYQLDAYGTAVYPDDSKIIYPALGLAGEAGEVANKVKKIIRDGKGNMPENYKDQIAGEIGDVLWYCATLAHDLGYDLGEIAEKNLLKLQSRQKRNAIAGSGDNR